MDSYKNHVLKGEVYGQVISENLSLLLRTYTDRDCRIQASNETGVGFQTVAKVATRNNVLFPTNEPAIVRLVELAIQKCEEALAAKNELAEYLEPKPSKTE